MVFLDFLLMLDWISGTQKDIKTKTFLEAHLSFRFLFQYYIFLLYCKYLVTLPDPIVVMATAPPTLKALLLSIIGSILVNIITILLSIEQVNTTKHQIVLPFAHLYFYPQPQSLYPTIL